ncbi:MAG: PadR family transcriptional regulator [Mycobacteriales bacterium]|nr:PadR family transcriptional regulator [Frankia sp.]
MREVKMSDGRGNNPSLEVLLSLLGGPMHGYAIADDIESRTGQRPGPGTLYGAISRLEERGLIAAAPAQDRRRPYRITRAGIDAAREELGQMQATVRVGLRRLRAATS